jgi:hypothetical protein
MSNLDPVTLTVIQNGLIQVCNEMDLAFVRSAFSPVISEGMDRSDGIYDALDGALIAQGELGLPVFVGTMQFSTRAVIEPGEEHYAGKVDPGDVFIVNDPYLGGTHLMDVRFVKPFFYKGELFAWLANTGHWPDCRRHGAGRLLGQRHGRSSRRACACRREILQEGRDGPGDPVASYVQHRIADQRIGDIKAQAAALTTGEQRLTAADRPLRRRPWSAGDRRDAPSRRAPDARQDRGHSRRRLRGHLAGRQRRRGRRAADDQDEDHQEGRGPHLRHDRLEPALPRADEQRHRHHQVGDLSRDQAHLPRGADQSRHLRAAARSSSPKARSSMPGIRGRCRAAPPR